MWQGFPIRPDQASTIAQGVDHLYYFLTAVDLSFTFVIFLTIFYFAIRYRRRAKGERPPQIETYMPLEIVWTAVPLALCAVMFLWASSLYIRNARPPRASAEIFVIGKQWMWKLQHPEGPSEINELHVPVGQPVELTMTSLDVIHDFFIPAFRVKKDVVPGRYSTIWFEATKTGKYHFFCAQYCGAYHSQMTGWVYVMNPTDYERWLSGGVKTTSMAQSGALFYEQFGCITCHGTGKGPPYAGLYGSTVSLSDGSTVVADDAYIRESILAPSAKIVAGYQPIMPTFQGQISEEQILDLLAYIKSLSPAGKEGAK
ncbi:MAG: cytochrome c oxidase subunit II [Acidobacteria bacterium]|nr:MAG: cytochrome c oxidase subunit II [Acidobacteriota bacterium]